MDNRRLVLVLILLMPLFLFWGKGVDLFYKGMGWAIPQPTTQPAAQTADNSASSSPTTSSSTSQATTGAAESVKSSNGAMFVVSALAQPPVSSALGSTNAGDSNFAMQVNVDPVGAGLSSVVLNSFDLTPKSAERYSFQSPGDHPEMKSLASKSIRVDGATYDLAGVPWSLISQTPTEAVYGADLSRDGKPVIEIRKQFDVSRRSDPDEGYELSVSLKFANKTDHPLTIQTSFNGTIVPPMETTRDRQIVTGTVNGTAIDLTYHAIEEFKSDKNDGKIDLTSPDHKVMWVGAVSNYFGAIVLPGKLSINGKDTADNYITSIVAQGLDLDQELIDYHKGYLSYQTGDITLPPGGAAAIPLTAYLGPKWRNVLDATKANNYNNHYEAAPRQYNLLLVIKSGLCAMCTFDWMLQGLAGLLRGMHFIFHDWGLAIIGLVAIVRVCLHPITRRSQISMSRMSKLGPEMKKLQEKHKDDKEAYQKAMLEYQKEQGLGPYLGCLPMFLQLPIWAALYGVLQTTFELRHASFLGPLTWIHDLSQPDYIIKFAQPIHIPLLIFSLDLRGICIIPFLLAAAMYLQARFMPQAAAATPEQMQQQKMMRVISPIMFLVIFYSYPSGLSLYVATSTVVGIIEAKVVRDHIKAKEEAEKAGKVFVPTKPTRAGRQGKLGTAIADEPKKGGLMAGLSGFWAKMLEQAELARQDKNKGNDRSKGNDRK